MSIRPEVNTNTVSSPSHYTKGSIEVIDFIVDQKLGYRLGNAIKYICRCNHKGNKKEDLRKAIQYLKFVLNEIEGRSQQDDGVQVEPFTQEISFSECFGKKVPAGSGGACADRKCTICGDICECGEAEDSHGGDRLDSSHCYRAYGPDFRDNRP